MIHLFTDFTWDGPYVGQIHAALNRVPCAQNIPVIDLMHDAPKHDPRASAYLLAALARHMAPGDICVGVVDPGVGTQRDPCIVVADGRYFVGPDNGLFDILERQARKTEAYRITWRPEALSASFHGRDLFAPIAAKLAARHAGDPSDRALIAGLAEPFAPCTLARNWPDDLDEVIYIDGFGNCILGRRAGSVGRDVRFYVDGRDVTAAHTFGAAPRGTGFWYENSMGLVEIAVNQGSAAREFRMTVGAAVKFG